jgi:hypothetical protein
MTSSELSLVSLIRTIVQASIPEAIQRARVPKTLSGTVEDLDEDLDVVFIRLDQETMGVDPTESDNFESPGVIAATRIGETFTEEQVRVVFNGEAGASATRTSIESRIVLPFGTESGQRIVIDGVEGGGFIVFVDENDLVVGYLDPTVWFVGTEGGARAIIDPLGGVRLRDANDETRVQLSATEGLVVRDAATGISGVTVRHDGIVVTDPVNGKRVSIASGTTGVVPTPNWASSVELSPGTTHTAPALSGFGTGNELAMRFVCASAASSLGAQSYTPPSGHTERSDLNDSGSGLTLASSAATKTPETNAALATFTNTSSGWTRANGHTVLVRGSDTVAPTFRSASTESVLATGKTITVTVDYPTGAAEGDILVAGVALCGAAIPVGWSTPESWVQLGLQVAGLGTSHVLGSGVWYSRVPASPPSSETFEINMSSAVTTRLQVTVVAVQSPFAFPGGLDIRLDNRSMPRGRLASDVATTTTTSWTNAQLPQVVGEVTGLELLSGRSYKISYDCASYTFAALSAACRVGIEIQLNTGSGYTDWFRVLTRQMATAGTEIGSISNARTYTPAANETVSVRVRLVELAAGAGFNIQLAGSAVVSRTLAVDDDGAEF